MKRVDFEEVFLASQTPPTGVHGCRLWTGRIVGKGYGQMRRREGGGRRTHLYAHVYAWTRVNGPVPPGLVIDHLVCDTPLCVEESHLCPTTSGSNVLRGRGRSADNARKMVCKRGHPFTSANTHINRRGARECRACGAMRARIYRAAKKLDRDGSYQDYDVHPYNDQYHAALDKRGGGEGMI